MSTSSSSTISTLNPSGASSVTIVVAGDAGVGKTSIISSLVSENFNARVPSVLQAVLVPSALTAEKVVLTVIDTTADGSDLVSHLTQPHSNLTANAASNASSSSVASPSAPSSSSSSPSADIVLLVVSTDQPDSFSRIESYWLPLIEAHTTAARTRIPVVLAINKSAPEEIQQHSMNGNDYMSPSSLHTSLSSFQHLLRSYRLFTILPISAKYLLNLQECFFECTKIVLNPIQELFELVTANSAAAVAVAQASAAAAAAASNSASTSAAKPSISSPLTPRPKLLTQRALLRIFRLYDHDQDGLLNFHELNRLHECNFRGKLLARATFDTLVKYLKLQQQQHSSQQPYIRYNAHQQVCITYQGFLWFYIGFIEQKRHAFDVFYLVRKFGYVLNGEAAATIANPSIVTQNTTNTNLPPTPSMQRGSSLGGGNLGKTSSDSSAAATSSLSASSSVASHGSLLLDESYYTLGSPYNSSLSYELTPTAIDFLIRLFREYDTDGDGLIGIKTGGQNARNPLWNGAGTGAAGTNGINQQQTPHHAHQQSHKHHHNHHRAGSAAFSSASTSSSSAASLVTLPVHSDFDSLFLTSPDIPFNLSSFTKYLPYSDAGPSFINLDAWLSAWALAMEEWTSVNVVQASGRDVNATAATAFLAAAATSWASSSSPQQPQPNPDHLFRYLAYLCFPVAPASPEFTLTSLSTSTGDHSRLPKIKTYLPKLCSCVRVTPKVVANRASVDAAIQLNETILSSDPSISLTSSTSRAHLSDLRPKTVNCYVIGSAGAGKTQFIEAMLGKQPTKSMAMEVRQVSGGAVSTQSATTTAKLVRASSTGSTTSQQMASATPSSSAKHTPTQSVDAMTSLPSEFTSLSASSSSSSAPPRAYCARLPLAHIPAVAVSSYSRSLGVSDESNRFLILRDVPSHQSASLLSSPSFTSSSSHLLLLLYDGTSRSSLNYLHQLLPICYAKQLPLMIIQTHTDSSECSSPPRKDFIHLDYKLAEIEEWSNKIFWTGVKNENQAVAATEMMHVFQRIYQAAQAPSPYILTSLSAAARSSQLTRRIFLGITSLFMIGAGVVGLLALRKYKPMNAGVGVGTTATTEGAKSMEAAAKTTIVDEITRNTAA